MKYCSNCGNMITNNGAFCPECGARIVAEVTPNTDNEPNFGYALLGFFLPIVGIILYFMWKNEKPGKAKSALRGALFDLTVLGAILLLILLVAVKGGLFIALPIIIAIAVKMSKKKKTV